VYECKPLPPRVAASWNRSLSSSIAEASGRKLGALLQGHKSRLKVTFEGGSQYLSFKRGTRAGSTRRQRRDKDRMLATS